MKDEKTNQAQGLGVSVNLDTTPILFTANVFMSTTEDGVVLDFAQQLGNSNQARVVSRIGMSREHAKKLVQKLGELIITTEGSVQTGKGKLVN